MAFGANSAITGGNSNYTFGDNSSATGGWNSAAFRCNAQIQSGGDHSYAFGHNSSVSAYNAVNFAYQSPARFCHLAMFGLNADTTALVPSANSSSIWIATDPLFVVANGATNASRSNALIILKDGTTTFHDSLSVLGNATFAEELTVGDTLHVAAPALFADSVYIQGNLEISGNLTVNGVPVTTYTAGTGVDISGSTIALDPTATVAFDAVFLSSGLVSPVVVLIPQTTLPGGPGAGMIVYHAGRLKVWNGSTWKVVQYAP